jgi:rare lipoprotein A
MLHLRALLRMARRRPSIVLGLVLAVGSAVTTTAVVGTAFSGHSIFQSSVTPLAPAPAPPAPPKLAVVHRLLSTDLAKMNPLRGLASWYGDVWNGRTTASGETFDETKLTAAHKTLPLGTLVRVTDLRSRRTVVVKINDRGTLAPRRVIDLSSAAARELGILEEGLARVKLEVIGKV